MSKFCPKCGNALVDTDSFCGKCGSSAEANSVDTPVNNTSAPTGGVLGIKKREIAIAILLSIVTCGIYAIYWFVCLTDDVNQSLGKQDTSGGVAFLYTLLTCGIYGHYWSYKMGQKMTEVGKKYGKNIEDRSVLYLILSLFGFGIINYCLIQNDLNSIAEQ